MAILSRHVASETPALPNRTALDPIFNEFNANPGVAAWRARIHRTGEQDQV